MVYINGYAPTLIYFRGMYGAEKAGGEIEHDLLPVDGISPTK